MSHGVAIAMMGTMAVSAEVVTVMVHMQENNVEQMKQMFDQLRDLVGVDDKAFEETRTWLAERGAFDVELSPARTHISCQMDGKRALQLSELHYDHDGPKHVKHAWISAGLPQTVKEIDPKALTKRQFLDKALTKTRESRKLLGVGGDSDPNSQKQVIGMPLSQKGTNKNHTQMVWGTGTYGVQRADLSQFWSLWDVKESLADVTFEGVMGVRGGNYKEGCLDAEYITGMGNGIKTIVSNTDKSPDAENGGLLCEVGLGYGKALLNQVQSLSNSNSSIPAVLSLSLGSNSFASCDMLCNLQKATTYNVCWKWLTTTQHQVCMFESQALTDSINIEFMKLGLRGMSIFASAGDGGSHWAFGPFDIDGTQPKLATALNRLGCEYNWPVFPAESPYVTAVGGTDNLQNQKPWVASGGGFSWTTGRPDWQKNAVQAYLDKAKSSLIWPAATAFNVTNRAYPDVASYAGEVPVITNDSPGGLLGTSVSAPVFAGVISMINDIRQNAGLSNLGFLNPRIYLAAASKPGELFNDKMSTGSSRCDAGGDCCSTGYPVEAGWNPITGLGWGHWQGLKGSLSVAP